MAALAIERWNTNGLTYNWGTTSDGSYWAVTPNTLLDGRIVAGCYINGILSVCDCDMHTHMLIEVCDHQEDGETNVSWLTVHFSVPVVLGQHATKTGRPRVEVEWMETGPQAFFERTVTWGDAMRWFVNLCETFHERSPWG